MTESQAENKERQEQLEVIYQTAPMGIALLDEDLRFVTSNSTFLTKVDYTAEEIQSKTITELCHPWDRAKAQKIIKLAKENTVSYTRDEIRLDVNANSYLWVEISVQYIAPNEEKPGSYVVMVQNIQRRKEIQQEVIELRRRMMQSNEIERKNLAQELHDGPMQNLHSISFQIAAMIDEVPENIRTQLELIASTVNGLNKELRAIAYDLRPPALSKFGLARSIKSHADEIGKKYPELAITLDLVSDRNLIAEDVSLALFRIYQQSIMNIVRHANASEVFVGLNMDGDTVSLEVRDNGKGFIVPEKWVSLVRAGHYGLAGTSERVHALGGEFTVNSSIGGGTQIVVKIPDYMES